jgi:hypothetical protein
MMLSSRILDQLRCALTHLVCALGLGEPSTGHEELASNRADLLHHHDIQANTPIDHPPLPVDSEPSPCWLARHCARRARSALEPAMPPAEQPRYDSRRSHQHPQLPRPPTTPSQGTYPSHGHLSPQLTRLLTNWAYSVTPPPAAPQPSKLRHRGRRTPSPRAPRFSPSDRPRGTSISTDAMSTP